MTTRDKILDEALTLFAENGYDGTSVEEIAEKVGIKAPVALWIAKADRQPECEQESMESIEKHVRHFCDVYMTE